MTTPGTAGSSTPGNEMGSGGGGGGLLYCGDNLEQLAKPALSLPNGLPDRCVDLIYIDPPFISNRTVEQLGEVFWEREAILRGPPRLHAGLR